MLLSKSIEVKDYEEMRDGVKACLHTYAEAQGKMLDINIPHDHRFWEYGSALQYLLDNYNTSDTFSVLDVGAGYGLLAPAIKRTFPNATVVEIDIHQRIIDARQEMCKEYGFSTIIGDAITHKDTYDVVCCMSVVEHIEEWEAALANLLACTRSHLILTVDFTDDVEKDMSNGYDRESIFGPNEVKRMIELISNDHMGIRYDLNYHGDRVFNYTFYRILASR